MPFTMIVSTKSTRAISISAERYIGLVASVNSLAMMLDIVAPEERDKLSERILAEPRDIGVERDRKSVV